jgi:molybdate transport system regulatory protein
MRSERAVGRPTPLTRARGRDADCAGADDALDLSRATANLKGWLSWDGAFLVGPRYIRLLEGIEREGTIRGGCRGTGLSYRTSLNRIRQMERILGTAMLTTRRGGAQRGGAALTPAARRFVRVYRQWREDVERTSRRAFARAARRRVDD